MNAKICNDILLEYKPLFIYYDSDFPSGILISPEYFPGQIVYAYQVSSLWIQGFSRSLAA